MFRPNQFCCRRQCVAALASLAWLVSARSVAAQSAAAPAVEPASYRAEAPAAKSARQTVRFGRQAPQVGDQVEQDLAIGMQLDTLVRQKQEVVQRAKTALRRHQHRVVTTTEVEGGMTTAVLVRYADATKELANGTAAGKLGESQLAMQPVHGKAYRVRREGESLEIVDEQGAVPPLDEFEIVALNMESLGKSNPLADFLAGKTLTIGQQLTLPNEVAEKLMGLGGEMGSVTKFELTLEKTATVRGATCAEFQGSVEAASSDSSQLRLEVAGTLVIEIDTCRAVEADFTGPICMSETRGSLTNTYQTLGTGKMSVHIASQYHDLPR